MCVILLGNHNEPHGRCSILRFLNQNIHFPTPSVEHARGCYYLLLLLCDAVSKCPCSLMSESSFCKLIGSYSFLYVSQMGFKMQRIPWKLFNRLGNGVSKFSSVRFESSDSCHTSFVGSKNTNDRKLSKLLFSECSPRSTCFWQESGYFLICC